MARSWPAWASLTVAIWHFRLIAIFWVALYYHRLRHSCVYCAELINRNVYNVYNINIVCPYVDRNGRSVPHDDNRCAVNRVAPDLL